MRKTIAGVDESLQDQKWIRGPGEDRENPPMSNAWPTAVITAAQAREPARHPLDTPFEQVTHIGARTCCSEISRVVPRIRIDAPVRKPPAESVKGLSLKFGGHNPWDMKNQSMNSDQAQSVAIRTSAVSFSKSVKGLILKFGGQHPSSIENRPMNSDRAQPTAVRYKEQTRGFGSSPDSSSPVLPFQSRARKRYDRISGAWFSKSVKELSLKFWGQHPLDMESEPVNSDRAHISEVQNVMFKAAQRKTDTAGFDTVPRRSFAACLGHREGKKMLLWGSSMGPDLNMLASESQSEAVIEPFPAVAATPHKPPPVEAPSALAELALEGNDPLIEASHDGHLHAPIPSMTPAPAGDGAISSGPIATPTTTVEVQNVPLVGDTVSTAALPSSSHEVDVSLWSDVDAQVHLEVPSVVSSGIVDSFDFILKQQMSTLHSMVSQNPDISYEALKYVADKLTGALAFMGCPLAGWIERVTMLLKVVKRRHFIHHEMSDQLTALAIQQSEYEAVAEPLKASKEQRRSVAAKLSATSENLNAKVARLEAELTATKVELDGVALAQEQAEEALLLSESQAASAEEKVEEIRAQRNQLKEKASLLHLGILPLEDIFRDLA
ncbi:hypothetical protein Taro_020569 [Colocasia esculenta]|uniref:Uncharacterized protein n=1 Tax=Colocasia esculenta TaxID=4460 RepID=A0A843UWM2_COLES|nr:hypothetical protein [Colocasia esculenta]